MIMIFDNKLNTWVRPSSLDEAIMYLDSKRVSNILLESTHQESIKNSLEFMVLSKIEELVNMDMSFPVPYIRLPETLEPCNTYVKILVAKLEHIRQQQVGGE